MKIVVDADACPRQALEICMKTGARHGIPVFTVASQSHNIDSANHFVVAADAQAADIKVINLTKPGDIVITQDWGLAAMVLGRGARCIGTTGKEYRADTIDFLLEEREAKARFRRGGGRTKGPSKRTPDDDRRFLETLETVIRSLRPEDPRQSGRPS